MWSSVSGFSESINHTTLPSRSFTVCKLLSIMCKYAVLLCVILTFHNKSHSQFWSDRHMNSISIKIPHVVRSRFFHALNGLRWLKCTPFILVLMLAVEHKYSQLPLEWCYCITNHGETICLLSVLYSLCGYWFAPCLTFLNIKIELSMRCCSCSHVPLDKCPCQVATRYCCCTIKPAHKVVLDQNYLLLTLLWNMWRMLNSTLSLNTMHASLLLFNGLTLALCGCCVALYNFTMCKVLPCV